jgi:dTDP-4-amino-4,6-dideoxygalactose transaminase
MRVPFVDLHAQYESIKRDVNEAIEAVIHDAAFIGGAYVESFEKAFADYCGVAHAVGVSNGTDAIRLALLACGIGPGDEVITVPNTFIATTEAISAVGASFRFVDVEPGRFTMDPKALEAAITDRTRAIVPVHLYGQPAAMDRILAIARARDVKVVADAAQAHGARAYDTPIATLGDAVCFSFYPAKNLGAYGDAGAVVTNDSGIAHRVALLRDHGRMSKYKHECEGFNCRMDALQAAILSAKLRHLEEWTRLRRAHARRYNEGLRDVPGVTIPTEWGDSSAVYHLYVVEVMRRDVVRQRLTQRQVATGVHYPIPLHQQPAYAHLAIPLGAFPVSEDQSRTVLSLPMYPELSDEQIAYVVESIRSAIA